MPAEYEWMAGDEMATEKAPSSPLGPNSISACLVVRHEAAVIARCLESLSHVVDEIIVVHDGPCEDDTIDIATRAGCRVFVQPRYGHCEHHLPFAYEQARGEWLLTVDADEFLSAGLREGLRALTAERDVNGWAFLWPLWDGRHYVTTSGPYKLALARRSALRMVGIIHSKGEVDGSTRRVQLRLEHQPPYNNFTLRTIVSKWRPRALIQAREYVTDLNTLPRFNYPGVLRWTRRRKRTNRWAALLIAPAAIHTFFFVMRDLSPEIDFLPRLRFAVTQAIYRAMVTAYVAVERLHRTPSAASASSSASGSNAVAGE